MRKTAAKIPLEQQSIISTSNLRVGMTTVKDDRPDERLLSRLPSGACRGLHFRTQSNNNVCFLLGGHVTIKIERNNGSRTARA